MKDQSKHLRRSIRLRDYDYSQEGAYFLTLCTHQQQTLFGRVVDEKIVLSEAGQIVGEEWLRSANLRAEIVLDEFIIMPNHLHGVVFITFGDRLQSTDMKKAHCRAPLQVPDSQNRALQRPARSLGSFIAQFKAVVTTRIRRECHSPNQTVWQRNYYDHIIRDEKQLYQIRKYIQENPLKWQLDKYFTDL